MMMEKDIKLDQSAQILIQQILNKVSDEINNPVTNVFIFIWQNENQVKKIEKYVEHRVGQTSPIGKPFIGNMKGEKFSLEKVHSLLKENNCRL